MHALYCIRLFFPEKRMSFHSLTSLIIKWKIGSGETHMRYELRQSCPLGAGPGVRPQGMVENTGDESVKSYFRNERD
jgi:hypothetical protein